MMTTPQDTGDLADLNAIMAKLPEEAAHNPCDIVIKERDEQGRIASIEIIPTPEEIHNAA